MLSFVMAEEKTKKYLVTMDECQVCIIEILNTGNQHKLFLCAIYIISYVIPISIFIFSSYLQAVKLAAMIPAPYPSQYFFLAQKLFRFANDIQKTGADILAGALIIADLFTFDCLQLSCIFLLYVQTVIMYSSCHIYSSDDTLLL